VDYFWWVFLTDDLGNTYPFVHDAAISVGTAAKVTASTVTSYSPVVA
jgi:hypothetical protein